MAISTIVPTGSNKVLVRNIPWLGIDGVCLVSLEFIVIQRENNIILILSCNSAFGMNSKIQKHNLRWSKLLLWNYSHSFSLSRYFFWREAIFDMSFGSLMARARNKIYYFYQSFILQHSNFLQTLFDDIFVDDYYHAQTFLWFSPHVPNLSNEALHKYRIITEPIHKHFRRQLHPENS